MTRISEKVRDIVEVRPYTSVEDLVREPETTLKNYHFTDGTAFMMGRWLESVISGRPENMCRAIAGFRGVGKSHFLATFAILMSHPELRAHLADTHVQGISQGLLRRHYPVVNVRRGLQRSLLDELAAATCLSFDLHPDKAGSTISELIDTIVRQAGGLTPILIIDSAPERSAPIDRNDGEVLAEIARACMSASVFVGLALDDDIAMADGSNAVVSQSYGIEYLDPEHLYKIVNSHIFPKNPRTQLLLGSLYEGFRSSMPDFRWSEQRFSSLYPLHPVLLEMAPVIRSYLPKFALFGFASSAGEKIMGRPANSLIGADDLFDAVEYDLRKIRELKAAFEAYDMAGTQVGIEIPVSARHKAKLVLKVMFLNSLAQRGSSGAEIAAALMIADNGEPGSSVRDIDAMLGGFAAACPGAISVDYSDSSRLRYKFNIGSDEFTEKLELLIKQAGPSAADKAFFAAISGRFPELANVFGDERGAADLFTVWRGGLRPGRIIIGNQHDIAPKRLDWEVSFDLFGENHEDQTGANTEVRIKWKVAELSMEERRALVAHSILAADKELRIKYSEQFSASAIAAANDVAAAIERAMITDAGLVIDGFDYNFSETARAGSGLTEMLGAMLEPLFETIFPEHPYFIETLDAQIVDRFVKSLSDNENAAVDQAALTFGVPLGIVEFGENGHSVLRRDDLKETPSAAEILRLTSEAIDSELTDLALVEARLAERPAALTSEATRLVLSSMAHRGLVDLITSDGERVGGRSIDLKLDWSDIAFVAPPRSSRVSDEKLLEWAGLVTGEAAIRSLSNADDRGKILEAFTEISVQWERRNPFETFEQIPDCDFSTNIWRHYNRTWDAYSAMVANVNETLVGNIAIDECLDRICSNFLSRPQLFHESRMSVTAIENFVKTSAEVARIANYLALAEATSDSDIELARERLRTTLRSAAEQPSDQEHREIGYGWEKFLRLYTEHYVLQHDALCKTTEFRFFVEQAIGKEYMASLFSSSGHGANLLRYRRLFRDIKRRFAAVQCTLDPTQFLQSRPFCACGFQLSRTTVLDDLAHELRSLVKAVSTSHSDSDVLAPV